tara:strand:- start:172 stop:567 length:396 start_codon:yes stop_codon:yes gene_type:complete
MTKKFKKSASISTRVFVNSNTNPKAPAFNQYIDVEEDHVTALPFSLDSEEGYRWLQKVKETGMFVLPTGLEFESGLYENTSKNGNKYYKGSVKNPWVPDSKADDTSDDTSSVTQDATEDAVEAFSRSLAAA